jgi:hypothetical protein
MSTLIPTHTHSWLKQVALSYVPGQAGTLADRVASELVRHFQEDGHILKEVPSGATDVILTTARFGQPLGWRQALMFTARRRYNLERVPTVFTIVDMLPQQLNESLAGIERALKRGDAVSFDGVPGSAHHTLHQQGKRGGPILYLGRVLQIQAKCIRILLVAGDEQPEFAYLFDLVGAHPKIPFNSPQAFYRDIAVRILTAASTHEITRHEVVEPVIKQKHWRQLASVKEMMQASREFGKRDFFTEMIHVSDLAEIPGFSDAISSQYSEGCFATWDLGLNALITTITGSARPVQKENITDQDLAVIVGIKPAEDGALIRRIEDHANHPPSSEAVEMIGMDANLPHISWSDGAQVPVIRSKLHGHRSVKSFNPGQVEYVPIPDSYQHYPVSCSTDAQYRAVQAAFQRSSALQDPVDPRQLVFTVLPGHGSVIVEKWAPGMQAFQLIWEAMDRGDIEITDDIPQGPFVYQPRDGRYTNSWQQDFSGREHAPSHEH